MSSTSPPNDRAPGFAAQFLAAVGSEILPQIDRATVPLVGIQDDEIRHDRTGVLYRIADHHFILTASHYLSGIIKHNIPLYISLNAENVMPVPLAEARFHGTEQEGRDVAAILLPNDVAEELGDHRKFIAHNQITIQSDKQPGLYVFFGYPMDWSAHLISDTDLFSRALAFVCRQYEGERHPTAVYHADLNILLEFDPTALNVTQNKTEVLPKLHGISGCGIWRIADWSRRGLQSWSPEDFCLVGIQHRWFPDLKYIQATRIAYALDLILDNYPDLEPAMSLVYPR